jgi:hypothetical protein
MGLIKNHRDFLCGALFLLIGLAFGLGAREYALGDAARMGPGYFPFYLGLILGLLGLGQIYLACHKQTEAVTLESFDWLTLAMLTGAIALFAAAIYYLGLILALVTLVILSSAASHEFTWKGTLANLAVILGLNLLIFVYGLSMPFQLWPSVS